LRALRNAIENYSDAEKVAVEAAAALRKAEEDRLAAERAAEAARLAAEAAEKKKLAEEEALRLIGLKRAEEERLAAEAEARRKKTEESRVSAEKSGDAARLAVEAAEKKRLAEEEALRLAALKRAEEERLAAEAEARRKKAEEDRLAAEKSAEEARLAAEAAAKKKIEDRREVSMQTEEAEPKPEQKPEPKPEPKPQPKPEAKPEPKPEQKPEPDTERVKLTFTTPGGEKTVWAIERPLGVNFEKGHLPMKVTSVNQYSHAEELGIQIGWILHTIDDSYDVTKVQDFNAGYRDLARATSRLSVVTRESSQKRMNAKLSEEARAEQERIFAYSQSLENAEKATRVKLEFTTPQGQKIVWATRHPLGVNFEKGHLPMKVTSINRGSHAEELGIQKDWILHKIDDQLDVSKVLDFKQGYDLVRKSTTRLNLSRTDSEKKIMWLKLVFLTEHGEHTEWATRGPLGLNFQKEHLPMTVTSVNRGSHAEELGIKKDWILKSIDDTDVSEVKSFKHGYNLLVEGTRKFADQS
jgi:hypothetical protein